MTVDAAFAYLDQMLLTYVEKHDALPGSRRAVILSSTTEPSVIAKVLTGEVAVAGIEIDGMTRDPFDEARPGVFHLTGQSAISSLLDMYPAFQFSADPASEGQMLLFGDISRPGRFGITARLIGEEQVPPPVKGIYDLAVGLTPEIINRFSRMPRQNQSDILEAMRVAVEEKAQQHDPQAPVYLP